MSFNKITLSGFAGSGKSAVGNLIASKLSYEFISIGNFSRDYTLNKFDMSINEFQDKCKKEPELDLLIDEKFTQYCNDKSHIVVDYRLGFKFVLNAFHVLLKVSDEIAVARINKADRQNELIDPVNIRKRNNQMRQRFIDLYGVDFTNVKNYNLVILTVSLTPEEISSLIIKEFKNET